MTTTTNYGLKKPDQLDNYNVDDFNDNADAIDAQMKKNADAITNMMGQLFTVVSVIDV